MKYNELELEVKDSEGNFLETKTYKMRLTAQNSIALEQKTGKSILQAVQDVSMSNIIRMLEYMNKDNIHNFGQKEAIEMYDLMVSNGYSMMEIMYDVIYQSLVHSGFLLQEELEELKEGIQIGKKALKEQLKKK